MRAGRRRTLSRRALLPCVTLRRCLLLVLALLAFTSLAHGQSVSPRRLLEVVDLGNPAISPDGRWVAFRSEQASVVRNTYDTVWYVQALEGMTLPLRVGEGGAPLREYVNGVVLPSPAVWSPDGHWLYYRARIDDQVSVWRAATDGSGAWPVTDDAADVRDFQLSADGGTLEYSVGATRQQVIVAEQAEYDKGVHLDGSVVVAGALFRSTRLEGRAATQRFLGDWFSTGPMLAAVPSRWRAVDLKTMATRDLDDGVRSSGSGMANGLPNATPEPERVAAEPAGERVAVLRPVIETGHLESRFSEVAVLPNTRSAHGIRCEDELCKGRYISDIMWRPGTDDVVFTATDYAKGRAQSLYSWNVANGKVRAVALADGLLSGSQRYWDIPCGISEKAMVCVAAEADRPPRLEAIDLDSGQRRVLFEPNKALGLDLAKVAPAELIRWTDEQGRQFTGHLFPARGRIDGAPAPLFVTFYNCSGFLRGGLGDEWPLASLAQQGISSLCINAYPEYRQDFVERYDQGRAAVEAVVRKLAQAGRIDPAQVGMGGLSYGSEVTLWTLMHSNVIKAASVSSVSATPTYYLFNSLRDGFRSNLMKMWQLGSPQETPSRWEQASPVQHIDQIRAPLLFQVPEQEFRLGLDYAAPLIRRKQADMYVFPEEAHIKFQPKHKLAVYERNVDWFRFWLQGYQDSSPGKADRYKTWTDMRAARDRCAFQVECS